MLQILTLRGLRVASFLHFDDKNPYLTRGFLLIWNGQNPYLTQPFFSNTREFCTNRQNPYLTRGFPALLHFAHRGVVKILTLHERFRQASSMFKMT